MLIRVAASKECSGPACQDFSQGAAGQRRSQFGKATKLQGQRIAETSMPQSGIGIHVGNHLVFRPRLLTARADFQRLPDLPSSVQGVVFDAGVEPLLNSGPNASARAACVAHQSNSRLKKLLSGFRAGHLGLHRPTRTKAVQTLTPAMISFVSCRVQDSSCASGFDDLFEVDANLTPRTLLHGPEQALDLFSPYRE